MKHFYSLSQYPGKTGEHFYNNMFKRLELQSTYRALGCPDIKEGVALMRDMKADGFSVSMPYKSSVIELLDAVDTSALGHDSCNTVVLENGKYVGYNTDLAGVNFFVNGFSKYSKVSILGDGCMGRMFAQVLGDRAIVYSRKLDNWVHRYRQHEILINCTSFGTSTAESPFAHLPDIGAIYDLAIKPNELQEQAKQANVVYVGGLEFYKQQFLEQFKLYTKKEITLQDIEGL